MKNAIPRYNFYKTKYGSELLIDVVDLQYTRKFLTQGKVHILTYYDITFITEGEGEFTIGNRTHLAAPGDVFFSKPGEVRSWDTDRIGNGHALIFEDTFLTSFFKDPLFVQHLPFFRMGKMVDKLQLPNGLYARILQLLHDIKVEIDSFHPHDTGILRALLYEVLMLLNRAYRTSIPPETGKEPHKDISSFHLSRFFELVGEHFREQHSVQFYADKLCITPNYLNEILSSAINIKAMLQTRKREGLKHIYLSTNTSSMRVSQFLKNNRACLYVCNTRFFKGVMLRGTMEILTDSTSKEMIWQEGDTICTIPKE